MKNTKALKKEQSIQYLLSNISDDGRFGKAKEVERRLTLSNNHKVATQGKTDLYVRFDINGKVKYINAESKINGGRVNDLLDKSNKAKYVIYSLEFDQKHKASKSHDEYIEHRIVTDKIIPTSLFCEKLIEFNAIKTVRHNGIVDGIAIQPSNKKWYEWLVDYPVDYNKEWIYEEWEFEGLE